MNMTTACASTEAVILKTDALGRVKTPAARREALLDEFERSGMSGRAFAEFVRRKYQTFASWAQQRQRRRKAATGSKPTVKTDATKQVRWMEAVLEQSQSATLTTTPLILHLPGGARLEIRDVNQISLAVALVRALSQPALSC